VTVVRQWNPDFYKTGYEGFEKPENFPTAESLENYRKLLLEKSAAQIEFITAKLGRRTLRALEIGAGNGRLLVGLAQRGVLEHGVGIDISQSRIGFAKHWISDLGIRSVEMISGDAIEFHDFEEGAFDLAVCITGAFGYLGAIDDKAPQRVLRTMHRALKPGGSALFELYQIAEQRRQMLRLNDGRLRTWQPLPAEDRFAYYLDDFQYFQDLNVLRHEKIFIGRDGSIDAGREEVLTYYTRNSFSDLLTSSGYKKPRLWADFTGTSYREGKSATLVALAERS
jgi:SAM-dependent methyltransferase